MQEDSRFLDHFSSRNIDQIKERILQYLDSKSIKKVDFFTTTEISPSNFKGKGLKSELSSGKIATILDKYPDLRSEWLFSGTGTMFKDLPRKKLEEERLKHKVSQEYMADVLEIPLLDYVDYEDGNKKIPEDILNKISDILNVPPYQLLNNSDAIEYLSKKSFFSQKKHEYEIPPAADTNSSINEPPVVYTGPTGNEYTEMKTGKYNVSVPLVPAQAYARYVCDFQHVDFKEEYETVNFVVDQIGHGKYLAFEIKGDSMDDDSKRSIPDRSTVLARELGQHHWKNKLNFRKFPYWIIVHQNNILCKEIIDHDVENGIIKCHSLNSSPEYTDFEIDLREVKQLLNIVKVQQDINFF